VKRAGCCTLCDVEVYEVKTRWTIPALAGEPRQIGQPTVNAVRATYALSDGSKMALTFCRACMLTAMEPVAFPEIWKIVLKAFERELSPEYLEAIGNKPRTLEQHEHSSTFVAGLANKSIIGFLGSDTGG
jgi:hypothetical protein